MKKTTTHKSASIGQKEITLTEKQVESIRLSRLEIAAGKFISNRLFEKEIGIWLKNR